MAQVEFYWNYSYCCLHPRINCNILRDRLLSCSSSYLRSITGTQQIFELNSIFNVIRYLTPIVKNTIYKYFGLFVSYFVRVNMSLIFVNIFTVIYKIITLTWSPLESIVFLHIPISFLIPLNLCHILSLNLILSSEF